MHKKRLPLPRTRPRPLGIRALWSGRPLVRSLTYRLATQLRATIRLDIVEPSRPQASPPAQVDPPVWDTARPVDL